MVFSFSNVVLIVYYSRCSDVETLCCVVTWLPTKEGSVITATCSVDPASWHGRWRLVKMPWNVHSVGQYICLSQQLQRKEEENIIFVVLEAKHKKSSIFETWSCHCLGCAKDEIQVALAPHRGWNETEMKDKEMKHYSRWSLVWRCVCHDITVTQHI